MIRLGKKIRLTRAERAKLAHELGFYADPRTVDEYNRLLETNAQVWEAEGSPEGRLLAAIYRGMKIDP